MYIRGKDDGRIEGPTVPLGHLLYPIRQLGGSCNPNADNIDNIEWGLLRPEPIKRRGRGSICILMSPSETTAGHGDDPMSNEREHRYMGIYLCTRHVHCSAPTYSRVQPVPSERGHDMVQSRSCCISIVRLYRGAWKQHPIQRAQRVESNS